MLKGSLADEIPVIKDRHSGDILVAGSGQLVGALLRDGLVDELRLMTFPIVLGSGKRLFAEGTRTTRLSLIESQTIGSDGITIMTFVPKAGTA